MEVQFSEKEITYSLYAIIDIETTGGKYDEEGITEIAIYRFDGNDIVDKFVSLVNPEREIQPFVIQLTGITPKMVRNAPKFHEIAKRIVEITEDCTLVAHNANFDNRILTTEFSRLGYSYSKKTLCTVELSKELIPNQSSYKLGKLCKSLGIPVSFRHRAEGDAYATVNLFQLLMAKDLEKNIIRKSVRTENNRSLAPKLLRILDEIPNEAGVFYVLNEIREILYIGRSENLKKGVNQLLLRTSKSAKAMQKDLVSITFERTGTELIAELKQKHEMELNKPRFNFASKNRFPKVRFNSENFMIIDRGRTVTEKTVILIQNQRILGYCYTDLSYQINHSEVLHKLITPLENSFRNRFLVKKYLNSQHNTIKEIVRF